MNYYLQTSRAYLVYLIGVPRSIHQTSKLIFITTHWFIEFRLIQLEFIINYHHNYLFNNMCAVSASCHDILFSIPKKLRSIFAEIIYQKSESDKVYSCSNNNFSFLTIRFFMLSEKTQSLGNKFIHSIFLLFYT